MQDLISRIQDIIGDYWESYREYDDAELTIRKIENLLDKYRHEEGHNEN